MSSTQAALPREVHVCLALLKLVLMCSAVGEMGGLAGTREDVSHFLPSLLWLWAVTEAEVWG